MFADRYLIQSSCLHRQPDLRFFTRLPALSRCSRDRRRFLQGIASVRQASSKTPTRTDKDAKRPPPLATRATAPTPVAYPRASAASAAAPADRTDSRLLDQARRLLGDHDTLLLYTAPSHKSLVFSSLLGGTTFLTVCATAAQTMLMVPNFSAMLRLPALIGALLGITISSAIFWTPLRQIQSLRLIQDPQHGPMMQVESKSRLLTGRKRRFDVPLDKIRADRDIKAAVLSYRSILRSDGFEWTDYVKQRESLPFSERMKLSWKEWDIRQSLATLWPIMKLDTARMFSRSGMVYLRIENQNWKLDLIRCSLLDKGIPLSQLIKDDPEVRDSVIGTIRRQLSST